MNWNELCKQIADERGRNCEICGKQAHDFHHAVMGRRRKAKFLDNKHNILVVCRDCHAHSDDAKKVAWKILCDRYGRTEQIAWLESVPLLVKPLVSWLERDNARTE